MVVRRCRRCGAEMIVHGTSSRRHYTCCVCEFRKQLGFLEKCRKDPRHHKILSAFRSFSKHFRHAPEGIPYHIAE